MVDLEIESLRRLAAELADMLVSGDVVLLEGALGAGKTEFARALLRRACGDPHLEVPSPSFSLVQQYDAASGTITHLDLYRLSGPEGLRELGWEELREGVVLVEWPDRLGRLMPIDALRVGIGAGSAADMRRVSLSGWGRDRLGELTRRFAAG